MAGYVEATRSQDSSSDSMTLPNKITGANAGGPCRLPIRTRSAARIAQFQRYRDMKLHSILFGWSDPNQALRVAAGILGERASDGLRLGGRYCQRCEAFPTMHRTWKPQSGVESELGDMIKTN